MITNATIYRITSPELPSIEVIADAAAKATFIPCGATQTASHGWVPPRGNEHGPLVESVGVHLILKLQSETKAVPGDVLRRRVDDLCKHIEGTTGRKPGKKQTKEIKEEVTLELLPQAFAKRSSTIVWIDCTTRILVVALGSQGKSDEIVGQLVKSIDGLAVANLQTTTSPAAMMSEWLVSGEPPAAFSVDRECELKSTDEMKSVVKYGRHSLDIEDVRGHITGGKVPTKLAMTWQGRVSVLLTDTMQVKKISFLDVVFEGRTAHKDEAFDADAAIATGELSRLIPDLIDALGGEHVLGLLEAA